VVAVVLVAVIDFGEQSGLLLIVNVGVKGGSMQICWVFVSKPHLLPVFIVMVYVPACEKLRHKVLEPVSHRLGSAELKSFPKLPLLIENPVDGEIDQIIFGLIIQLELLPLFSKAPVDELVIQTAVFVQLFVCKVKSAFGGVET
jgi:hypothetical protein